ncbi:unnamed protein product [Schistosoma mattheei]|uniref:Uncharacterized protein n=1 Tax=Schistosoma mattheei TaxID=31246 RepID=A0A183Q618_9TREM|nr:unnamed protein product [Schistosoma mattheei]
MVASDQRLVHMPLVPSGYWSRYAPLVWNEGFSTSLGELSVSINPVKAPDFLFSSSQLRKQQPWCDNRNLRKIYALASKALSSYGILLQTLKKANLQPTTKIIHLSSKNNPNNNNDDNDVHACAHCYLIVLIHDLLKEKKISHHFLLSQIHELTKDSLAVKKLRHAYQSVDKSFKSQTENQRQNKGLSSVLTLF